MIGAFFELGPYDLKDGKEVPREVSWNDNYHLLFIDNPRGTGYSIADGGAYVNNSNEAALDFV